MKTEPVRLQGSIVKRAAMRGVAAVEFAILLPFILLPLAFGVVEYGRALYHYNTLVKAVRDGVRLLAQNNPTDPSYEDRQTQAQCLVVHGNPDCNGPPLVPGLTLAQVLICDRIHTAGCAGQYGNVLTGSGAINLVEVRIAGYQHPYLGLPYVPGLNLNAFNEIRATMRQIT